jgi:hypothetical protein
VDLPDERILSKHVGIGKVTTRAGMVDMGWCLMFQKVNVDASEVEVGRETHHGSGGGGVRGRGHHEVHDTEIVIQTGVRLDGSRAGVTAGRLMSLV